MTSEITRRAALSLVGAGTTVFLSACAATNVFVGTQEDASSPSASPKDYKGEAKLEEYDTSTGTFEPATHDTPPKNVPKPIKPKNADEDSVAGLYSSIAFLGAAITYAFTTGDTTYIQDSAFNEETKKEIINNRVVRKTVEGKHWEADIKLVYSLETSEPTKEGDEYTWPYQGISRHGAYYVEVDGPKTSVNFISESSQETITPGRIKAKHTGGHWVISFETDESASPSASSSRSSSI